MIFRFPAFWTIAFLIFFNLSSLKTQSFYLKIDSAQVMPGDQVCLAVRCFGFQDLISLQFSVRFDTTVIKFNHTQSHLSSYFKIDQSVLYPDCFYVTWAPADGFPKSYPDGSLLFEACFDVVGGLNSQSLVIPGSYGYPPGAGGAEAYNLDLGNIWDEDMQSPGLVEVSNLTENNDPLEKSTSSTQIQIQPNPANSTALLRFEAKNSGSAQLSVLRTDGAVVYQRFIEIKPGLQTVEISRQYLPADGLYWINLRTVDFDLTKAVLFKS